MRWTRRLALALLAAATTGELGAAPLAAAAAGAAPAGSASAAPLSLSINPGALLELPPQLAAGLATLTGALGVTPTACTTALTAGNMLGRTTASVSASDAAAVEPPGGGDLVSGSADAQTLALRNAALDPLLANLASLLGTCLAGPNGLVASIFGQSAVAPVLAPINLAPAVNTALQALQAALTPSLSALQDSVTGVTATLNGQQHIDGLSVVGVTTRQSSATATATDAAHAAHFGASGAQASGVQTLQTLGIVQTLTIGNAVGALQGLLGQLTCATCPATIFATAAAAATNATSCATLGSAVGSLPPPFNVVSTVPGVGTATCTAGGGVGTVAGVVASAVGAVSAALQTVVAQLQTIISALPALLQGIGIQPLLSVSGLTSTSTVAPSRSGVLSTASVRIDDITVGGLLPGVSASLPALVDVRAVGSTASAYVDGVDTTAPIGTFGVDGLTVLGQAVPVPASPGAGQTVPIAIPGLGTVTATVGLVGSTVTSNTPTHKGL